MSGGSPTPHKRISRLSILSDKKSSYLQEAEPMDNDIPISEFMKDTTVRVNFIIFIVAWTVTTFNNFMMQFLVNTYE